MTARPNPGAGELFSGREFGRRRRFSLRIVIKLISILMHIVRTNDENYS